MVASRKMRRANRSGVKKKPAEELSLLNSELLSLKRLLVGCAGVSSDKEFDDLIDRFDGMHARIGVLEKQLKREAATVRRKARKKK